MERSAAAQSATVHGHRNAGAQYRLHKGWGTENTTLTDEEVHIVEYRIFGARGEQWRELSGLHEMDFWISPHAALPFICQRSPVSVMPSMADRP